MERVLQQLVESAKELAGARYAAIGVPEGEGEAFAQFIYTGMSDELVARIGPLPRKHGLLAAMLTETQPYRAADIRKDPRFQWWPDAHPRMTSFLGVPILSRGKVIGAFYLVRRTVFEALAGFDERFFVYLEDLDFSVRAAAAGWECWYLASSRAYHRGGGTSERAKDSRLFYSLRSRLQYASKHFGQGGAAAVWLSTLVFEPVVRVGAAAASLQGARIAETLRGYLRLWAWAVNQR